MLGKLIDGRLVVAGRIVKEGNTTITNPTEEQLIANGYKGLCYNPKPDYDKEEEKLIETYTEEDVRIVIGYEKVELSAEEHNAIIQAEIVVEENKITPRNLRGAVMGDSFAYNKVNEVENNIAKLRAKLREITPKEEE